MSFTACLFIELFLEVLHVYIKKLGSIFGHMVIFLRIF